MTAVRASFLGWLLVFPGGCGPQSSPEPILIGHLAPLSGADQAAGRHARQGIQLAAARAKAEGLGIQGRTFTVVHGDTAGDPDLAGSETVRLLTVNHVVAIISGPNASCSSEVVRAARTYRAPVVVPGVAYPLPEGGSAVQLGMGPIVRGRTLARYVAGPLKARNAEVLTGGRDPTAAALADGFVREWSNGGGRMESLVYAPTDRAEKAAKVARDAPDVVLVAGPVADCLFFQEALKKADCRTRVLAGGADQGPEPFTATLVPRLDVYLATVFCRDKLTPAGQEVARRYQEEFHEPVDLAAIEAYDAAWLLFTTIHRAQSTDGDRLREELAAVETFEALSGQVTFKDKQVHRPLFVLRVADGTIHVEETAAP